MNIGVIGLGYVGAITAAVLAQRGWPVVATDIDASRVQALQDGRSPIAEPGLGDVVREVTQDGRLTATSDHRSLMQEAQVLFVCVATPEAPDGSVDPAALQVVARDLQQVKAGRDDWPLVVIRSTVTPDALSTALGPCFAGEQAYKDHVAVYPEFLREGVALVDFEAGATLVVGADSEGAWQRLAPIVNTLPGETMRTSIASASLLKYANNAFHALKITFANEIANLAASWGARGTEVMDLLVRDHRLNISPAYLKPGYAFGGSCLPKDVRALVASANQQTLDTHLLSAIAPSNEAHLLRAVDRLGDLRASTVGMFGLAFKAGTGDLRASPYVRLAGVLADRGHEVIAYDPMLAEGLTVPVKGVRLVSALEALEQAQVAIFGHPLDSLGLTVTDVMQYELDVVLDLCGCTELSGHEGYRSLWQ